MGEKRATLKYDFDAEWWVAVADWDDRLTGCGTSPEEAMMNLAKECNKHDLWPKK